MGSVNRQVFQTVAGQFLDKLAPALVLLVIPIAGAAQTALKVPAPIFDVGDTWQYSFQDFVDRGKPPDINNEWVTGLNPDGSINIGRVRNGKWIPVRLDVNGNYIDLYDWHFIPSLEYLNFPLFGWTLAPAQLTFTDAETRGVASSVGGAKFYLSHAALIAGNAPTPNVRFKGQRRSFDQHAQPLRLEFHGHHYEIVVDGGEVALREGARKSVFGNVAVDPNGYAETSLLWAGDLDGDGQLDLIIYAGSDKSGSICLLLSSANHKPGELLASVGCQDFSG